MGRGMRWSSIAYRSVPTPKEETPSGIELSCVCEDHEEEENELYVVRHPPGSGIGTVAVISATVLILAPLIVVVILNSTKSTHESGGVYFPSGALFGNEFGDDFSDSTSVKSENFSPPYDVHTDFRNELGNIPPYWEEMEHVVSSRGGFSEITSWGPCYRPNAIDNAIDWMQQVVGETPYRFTNDQIVYPQPPKPDTHPDASHHSGQLPQSAFYSGNGDLIYNQHLSGLCRPGFLIIGQAKCGTSSLYHYLIGHPRVLPASQKQLDYFKYLSSKPMEWYLSHFPSTETFLARGALITGESSPSYFPYSEVPHLIRERTRSENNGAHPRIIAILRDPVSRALSSYKYNYVDPALKLLLNRPKNPKSKAATNNIPKGMAEEYYREHHLFSFEELVRAEIGVLQQCLAPGGFAEQMSREKYGPPNGIYADAFLHSKVPLVNADEFCYGERISDSVPLAQWGELIHEHPDKVIIGLDYHLIRSIVGRSLYYLFLTWWYTQFSQEDIFIVCTEDLHFQPAETMLNVSLYLGLPEFDFANVTAEGMYNVGINQGYDTVTSWDTIQQEAFEENDTDFANIGYDVDLSDELQAELMDFFRPYNEALFQLTGKRCQWD